MIARWQCLVRLCQPVICEVEGQRFVRFVLFLLPIPSCYKINNDEGGGMMRGDASMMHDTCMMHDGH